MSKWNEDTIFEILTIVNNNIELKSIFVKEMEKSKLRYPYTEYANRVQLCYETSKVKYENL